MAQDHGLGILDALENLNALVDAKDLGSLEVTDDAHIIVHEPSDEAYFVHAGSDDYTVDVIKETFRSVHTYLEAFYKKMHQGGDFGRLVEGVNTIMVLVGEAGKKLEGLGALFQERVGDLPEYRDLQNFYHQKVVKELFSEFAKEPLPKEELEDLLGEEEVEEIAGVHILNDLDVIRKDHLYELFYLKNEVGRAFYTYELARSIKLACDFGSFTNEYFGDDPLLQIKNWEDKSLHEMAKRILKAVKPHAERFYSQAMKHKNLYLVTLVHQAMMGLMLAANSRNLIRQFSPKGCHLYFQDFVGFLKEALASAEYQRFLVYAPPSSEPFFHHLLELVQELCYALFRVGPGEEELQEALSQLAGSVKEGSVSKKLSVAFANVSQALQNHPSGPIFKTVDLIREPNPPHFDPLLLGMFPYPEWELDNQATLLRMASPTEQEFIHQAKITEEFKGYLRALIFRGKGEKHLLINFQDRTSWREHARALAIEELSRQALFSDVFASITLPKDTEFYNQSGNYYTLSYADEFIRQFYLHLSDFGAGYDYSPMIKESLFPKKVKAILQNVHKHFFENKKELSFEERLTFIEIAYTAVIYHTLLLTHANVVSLTSKDGLDIGGTSEIALIAFFKTLENTSFSEEEFKKALKTLLGPTLLHRERAVHAERFERLKWMLEKFEKCPKGVLALAR